MNGRLAIVGLACRYPDADSPMALWENILAGRRSFRRLPPERLRLEDYYSPNRHDPDRIYATEAALLTDYEFDRLAYRIAGSTYRVTDLTHWLALDVAVAALRDAGFAGGKGLPAETTGVIVGNTLTGEFSRASLMRLRWPYVRRVLESRLTSEWEPGRLSTFLTELEAVYKAPFPQPDEDFLAGGLANTIAGRVANFLNLGGGGFTVDGACSSSLLAVTQACSALTSGDLDVALVGGVDLSIDPFELVGFSRAGALAAEEMRVYDTRSAGFWPGEGCGFAVLMREEEARSLGLRIYGHIAGWGISSDGSGGMTRPEIEGQKRALLRAYRKAEFSIGSVALFEGHGTGTAVGDKVELQALAQARRTAPASELVAAAVGSVKANIGHTKAAAGMAGLIKAAMALQTQVLPPHVSAERLPPELDGLQILRQGAAWGSGRPLRAGVSSFGFGGINVHVALEGEGVGRRQSLTARERILVSSAQDAELFFFAADSSAALAQQVGAVAAVAPQLSRAELIDLACTTAAQVGVGAGPWRAAVVAATPAQLAERLGRVLAGGEHLSEGVYAGHAAAGEAPRIGFLFPGQGAPVYTDQGALLRRFPAAALPAAPDTGAAATVQSTIVRRSLEAARVLAELGLEASAALGHSLGELAALAWGGAVEYDAAVRLAAARGRAMDDLSVSGSTGAMATIGLGADQVERLLVPGATIACYNAPDQTVISGEAGAVARTVERAAGYDSTVLKVTHAFHSPLVAAAAESLGRYLQAEPPGVLKRPVISSVTGDLLAQELDLSVHLQEQVIRPVRFTGGMAQLAAAADLLIEVGPGRILGGLAARQAELPVISTDAGGDSLTGLLQAVGAAFALGAPVRTAALAEGRFHRPFSLERRPTFLRNPCEEAPAGSLAMAAAEAPVKMAAPATMAPSPMTSAPMTSAPMTSAPMTPATDALELVRSLVAAKAELPLEMVRPESRLLDDLHLNSLMVGQVVAAAVRQLGLPPAGAPLEFSGASVGQVAEALREMALSGRTEAAVDTFSGIDQWVRAFRVVHAERPQLPSFAPSSAAAAAGTWQVIAPSGYPLVEGLMVGAAGLEGRGVILCLPPAPDAGSVDLLVSAARAVVAGATRLVVVQQGGGGAAFARTVHLERPSVSVAVVDLPAACEEAVAWILAEAAAPPGRYTEAVYGADGRRRVPLLELAAPTGPAEPPGPQDLFIVTGGGKGIGAECALALARSTGARLGLLGRSRPEQDPELAANLERFQAAGVAFRYIPVDVADAGAVARAVGLLAVELGPVTGFLHAAGVNVPTPLAELTAERFRRTLAPKVTGLQNVLAAVDPERLRWLITFSSVIARAGMRGEADYALANEWAGLVTERWQAAHPACHCMNLEWSVWSGVGMGERLGRLEGLLREGITPISLDSGVAFFLEQLRHRHADVARVVASRLGDSPTVKWREASLPLLRFLEEPRVYVPGVELVADAHLSPDTDPYLNDHVLNGERIFPAVLGLEAMAQAAAALTGAAGRPVFSQVRFDRAVVVPAAGARRIRLAALRREDGAVELALRSDETDFAVDHFRAVCRFEMVGAVLDLSVAPRLVPDASELYDRLLFQSGRFRRIRAYRRIAARACQAELEPDPQATWFGGYLPAELLLGDPGTRDATLHAIQVCVPDGTLLPLGVDRLWWAPGRPAGDATLVATAVERSCEQDTFVYDLTVTDLDGRVLERWEGLRLRRLKSAPRTPDLPWLLGPYLQRQAERWFPDLQVAMVASLPGEARRERSDRAMGLALGTGSGGPIRRRPDGKPEAGGALEVSAAHAGEFCLAVAGPGAPACDLELLGSDPALGSAPALGPDPALGPAHRRLARTAAGLTGEPEATSALRVWTVVESLRKAGYPPDAPVVLEGPADGGWVLFRSGRRTVATCVLDRFVIALTGGAGREEL